MSEGQSRPTTRLAVAICPSNQGYNVLADGRTEAQQIAPVAQLLENTLQLFSAVAVRAFWSADETQWSPGTFPKLREQTKAACAWLSRFPIPTPTLAVHLHTDSGAKSHVGFYFGPEWDGPSARLGQALAQKVLLPFFDTPVLYSDNYARQGYIAWRECPAHTTLLLELGSHVNPTDVAKIQLGMGKLAALLAVHIATWYGVYQIKSEEEASAAVR